MGRCRIAPVLCSAAIASAGCGVDFGISDPDTGYVGPVLVTETFLQASNPKVDVLWVVDNTGSMAEEQAALAGSFDRFAEAADQAGLAYQLGVITTEMDGDRAGELQGDPWIITPVLDDPGAAFASAVSVGTDGLGTEAGLAAMLTALSPALLDGPNRGFRRADAALHVIAVSDDDDDSGAWLDDPVGEALDYLDQQSKATGLPAFLSAVVCTAEAGCTCQTGGVYGEAYLEVALASGGVSSDICQGDLGAVVATLGALSVTWLDTFELQARPAPDSVTVVVNEQRADPGTWALSADPPAVVFDAPPPPEAVIEVTYELAPEGGE